MSDNKRYYWLQMKEEFFREKEIKMLRKIAGGDTYTIIYLKMMLLSLRDNGKLLYEGVGSDFAEEIALEIDEDVENVKVTVKFLLSKNLMQISDYEGFMTDVPSMIGSETDSARRVRKHRNLKEKNLQSNGKALQSNNDVTKGNTEIDIELDIELEKEKDILLSSDEHDPIPYSEIVSYLNQKAERNYKDSTSKTKSLINARWNEGFSLDDFKKVVDNKVLEWKGNAEMSNYLRPETLFGTKFESYLNQKPKGGGSEYDGLF